MTFGTYLLSSILKNFNLYKGATAATRANNENRLATEGIEILGSCNWMNVGHIDELKSDHDRIKLLTEKKERLELEADDLSKMLNEDMGEKEKETAIQAQVQDAQEDFQFSTGERITLSRKINSTIEELKTIHTEKAQNLDSISEKTEQLQSSLESMNNEYERIVTEVEQKESILNEAKKISRAFQTDIQNKIGKKNKALSGNKLTQQQLHNALKEHHLKIGTYLYNNMKKKPVKKAIHSHQRVLRQIKALVKSSQYHQKLSH